MSVEPLPDVVMLAVPFFVASMVLELVVGRVTARARYDTLDTATSLAMGVGNLVSGLAFGFLGAGLLMLLYPYRLMTWGDSVAAWVMAYVLDDLRYYWYHRFAHVCRWWWWGHVTHHSSQHYNLSTALRQEWASPWNLDIVMRVPLVLVFGIHPVALAFLGGINLVYQYWIHTEMIGRFPSPIEWVFNTPSHHRVHHGSNARYLDANYAGTFILWDRLFGTFVPELDDEPVRYGLVKNLSTHHPLRVAFHELVALVVDATRPGLTVGQRLRYVFGPPGYSHDGTRRTAAEIKSDVVRAYPERAGTPGLPSA